MCIENLAKTATSQPIHQQTFSQQKLSSLECTEWEDPIEKVELEMQMLEIVESSNE